MPKSYPSEFRRRVIELMRAGGSASVIARDLGVAEATIYRWVGETLCLTVELSEGKGTIAGSLATPDATRRLSFELIDVDQAFVSDALACFQEIVGAFPVRGDPHAD